MSTETMQVTAHVGRNLLAAAASFKTEAAVAWEYIANALQYVERGVNPVVDVRVTRRELVFNDNARGMTSDDLNHYFTMHAENRDRRAGRPGRGKWGTGKSAAFGVVRKLTVDTVRGGVRNVVSLTRDAIDRSEGSNIPLDWEVRNQPVGAPNGTTVTIGDLAVRVDAAPIIEYVQRHLAFFRASAPRVAINNHLCEYDEPTVVESRAFRPSAVQADVIGDVELIVKVARAPLKEFEQGIAVTAGFGNLIAIERAGIERKEFGTYLFGEVDVPALERESTVAPYDSTRNLQLNPKHPAVAVLVGFIGSKLEEVRLQLIERHRQARQTEQARRLAQESAKIASLVNADFRELTQKLAEIRVAAVGSSGRGTADGGSQPDGWVQGPGEPGTLEPRMPPGPGTGEPRTGPPPALRRGYPNVDGEDLVEPVGADGNDRRRSRGSFKVEYRELGSDQDRSLYDSASLTIVINLEHPVLVAALADGDVENVTFRRLSYEIAVAEYAVALGYQMTASDPEIPADDLLYEVRTTLNRIARAAAPLYR